LSKRIVPRRRPRVKRDVLMRAGTIEVVKRGASRSLTLLTNATVRLGVLLPEVSAEGHSFRYVHDLALLNATLLFLFALTWTVMHRIDENSPLADYDAEQFVESDARLLLTIEARDHALGTAVHDMRIYMPEEVLFGTHYAEAVTFDDQKRPFADLTRLSLVEADGAGAC
jgi:inward rectifier potassium channel